MTKARNTITRLVDGNGVAQVDIEKISSIVVDYFSELFIGGYNLDMEEVLKCIQPRVT